MAVEHNQFSLSKTIVREFFLNVNVTKSFYQQLKLFRLPHGHAVRTFELLVSHMKAHYYHGYSTYIASVIRNLVGYVFYP